MRQRVAAWYDRSARDLPWRQTTDPYAIWVSEIMLQQTQVATVIDYYLRFLAAYPDVASLAGAEEQDVLRLWAGLGYYRRARQLHAAAQQIVAGSGRFPRTLEAIQELPGVGRYTAGAIASFAFDLPAPIVEANTQRLFSRLLELEVDPRSRDGQLRLWSFAGSLLADNTEQGAGRINQAVMELGSQVCTPRDPDCPNCPLVRLCPTFEKSRQHEIPMAAPKKSITELTHIALIIEDKERLLLRQNSAGDWWQGLWDFPRVDASESEAFPNRNFASDALLSAPRAWLASELQMQHGLHCVIERHHSTLKHSVTRYRITLHAFAARLIDRPRPQATYAWHSIQSASQLPLTAPAKRLVKSL